MEIILYISKVTLYWALLLACYQFILRKHTFFVWNRLFLMGSLLASFALPSVIYPETAPAIPLIYEFTMEEFTTAAAPLNESIWTWVNFFWAVYAFGVLYMSIRLATQFVKLNQILKSGETIPQDGFTLVLLPDDRIGSFSFFNTIVINRNDYEHHFDAILNHEMVHSHQKHSIDILLIEVLYVLLWFNPFLILYKKAIQEVHEFLADKAATNRDYYALFLVSYSLDTPIARLTNHFFKTSQIKSRIAMLYKNRTSKWMLSTYIGVIAMVGIIAVLIAGCETNKNETKEALLPTEKIFEQQDEDKQAGIDAFLKGKKIYTVVEIQPEFPGGNNEMYKFMGQNIKYPLDATNANIEGRVFLSFVVTETGEIGDIKVLKGIGFGCDEEAVRVLKLFPKWEPGIQDGQPINVRYNLPINFQLAETKPPTKKTVKAKVKESDIPVFTAKLDPNFTSGKDIAVGANAEESFGGKKAIEIPSSSITNQDNIKATKETVTKKGDTTKTRFLNYNTSNLYTNQNNTYKLDTSRVTVSTNQSVINVLIVIDGNVQKQRGNTAVESLNPDKIKSMNVLKGESAIEKYGTEGAGGVIEITTKK